MNWKTESFGDVKARMFKWHKVFAWFPIFSYGTRTTYWLSTIERRATSYSSYCQEFDFEYREPK